MKRARTSDGHKGMLGPALCSDEQHRAAWEAIKHYVAQGLVQPVEGFDDTAEAYADILGIRHG